ncbi:uncharacterized protein LOC127291703 [Leptopilina boulardi]|uniref:uncharacterized protein LOC127291703 n=1 Tax=Leptopilina boulardi TaxID=63433 RepID=UPI0021F5BFD6|nr:uncharacterized protein LOC127291703 [Leptopilina boulardi]
MANRQTRNDSQYSGITTRVGNQGCIKLASQPDPPHSPVLRAGERIFFFVISSGLYPRARVIEFRHKFLGRERLLFENSYHSYGPAPTSRQGACAPAETSSRRFQQLKGRYSNFRTSPLIIWVMETAF